MLILLPFVIIAAFILIPKKVILSIKIRINRIDIRVVPKLIFGAVPIKIDIRLLLRAPDGIAVLFSHKRAKPVYKEKKKGSSFTLRSLRVEKLCVTGEVGIEDHPDKSVILAGLIDTAVKSLTLAFLKTPAKVGIVPELTKNAFAVNIEGIARAYPGRMLIEAINKKRRNKNESSNRKHNAVIDGAHQKAC